MARDDLIWQNATLGTETYYHFDEGEREIVLETVQDVGPVMEANKAEYNDAPSRFGEWQRVARISAVVMLQLVQQGILSPGGRILDEKRLSDWLNSSDNRNFRTFPGRV